MEHNGWVKIHRKLLDNPIVTNLELLGLFATLLLKASHKDTSFFLGTKKVSIKKGQFISSQKKLAIEFGISRTKMIRLLDALKSEKILDTKGYSKYTVFTLLNWNKYQVEGTPNDTPSDTTSGHQVIQQADTIKNDKNDKNENTIQGTVEGFEQEEKKLPNSVLPLFVDNRNTIEKIGNVKGFVKCKQITPALEASRNKLTKEYTMLQIKEGVRNYAKEIKSRKEGTSYATHRFSLLEFLKQENGIRKFINNEI